MRTIVFITVLGFLIGSCTAQSPGVENSSATAFKTQIQSGDKLLLDVRTPDEYASGHVPGAQNIDWYEAGFQKSIEAIAPDKTRPVYLYCKSGGRSGQAAAALSKMGYTKIINMDGGIDAWTSQGFPTE